MRTLNHEGTKNPKHARSLTLAVLLSVGIAGFAQSGNRTLFEGARLIAGDGRAPIENSAILVENDSIVRVAKGGEIAPPRGARRVDLTGKTIIPGLVLLHGHVGYLSASPSRRKTTPATTCSTISPATSITASSG